MSFAERFMLVLLAAFFLSSVITSLIAFVCASPLLRSRDGVSARDAGALALYRLMPAGAALALTLLVFGPGYFAHEQRAEAEGSGAALFVLAAGGLALLLWSAARLARAAWRASTLRRAWLTQAAPIDLPGAGMPAYALDLPFPLVAVLGIVRPTLFVSRVVLDTCAPAEMAAILEHERAHVRRRDNAVRLLMDAAPDLLGPTRLASAVAAAWHRAVEQRADDAAGRRLDLAAALVKIARIAAAASGIAPAAAATPALDLPASALYRGESAALIGDRVRRLVDGEPEARPARAAAIWTAAAAAGAAICGLALTGAASRAAHAVLEITVSRLP